MFESHVLLPIKQLVRLIAEFGGIVAFVTITPLIISLPVVPAREAAKCVHTPITSAGPYPALKNVPLESIIPNTVGWLKVSKLSCIIIVFA